MFVLQFGLLKIQSAHGIVNLQRSKQIAEGRQAEEACDFLETCIALKLNLHTYFLAFSTDPVRSHPSTFPRPATLATLASSNRVC